MQVKIDEWTSIGVRKFANKLGVPPSRVISAAMMHFGNADPKIQRGRLLQVEDKIRAAESGDTEDEWDDRIGEYLEVGQTPTTDEVLAALGLAPGERTRDDRRRVAKCMRALGWANKVVRIDGTPRRVWVSAAPPA